MNNEEILKAAQANPQKKGEFEKEVGRKSALSASAAGVLLCTVMMVVELWVFKKVDFGKPSIIALISSVMNLKEGKETKCRKMIVEGILEAIVTLVLIMMYVGALFL